MSNKPYLDNLPLITREHLEQHENQTLAPYATRSKESMGRIHPEEEHPFRTCFQRDRDRIIHCVAFRRLEYKTQVFINSAGDHYRTRLTHSLEVAQIARSLARMLGANEDLCEAVALAHDLGHPPFGHSGERVLNRLLGEDNQFEHNAQALRIVDTLENRYPEFPGLNLTAETRFSILKGKPAYEGTHQHYPGSLPVEAQIVDMADEISYTTHDLDDGIESRLLEKDCMLRVPLWNEAHEEVQKRSPEMDIKRKRYQIIIHLINMKVMNVAATTKKRLEENLFQVKDDLVGYSDDMAAKCKAVKQFLWQNLYRHPEVLRSMSRSQRILQGLFEHYIANPEQLPPSYLNRMDAETLERVVADYLSGMTDRFAEQDFRQLYGY
ncbi:deoxyguanosinetriphosphate triphosphohydrolase [bacterium]|nr:deoxyguanosinetriphosphate triphosphohydrolase [bacterium]